MPRDAGVDGIPGGLDLARMDGRSWCCLDEVGRSFIVTRGSDAPPASSPVDRWRLL
jgi:hypothetical protein